MAFPATLTEVQPGISEIKAAHLNNLEAKVGIDDSEDPASLDYLLKSAGSLNPGHKHNLGGMSFNGLTVGQVLRAIAVDQVAFYPLQPSDLPGKVVVVSANNGATLTTTDFGKTFTVNSSNPRTIFLPSVDIPDIGGSLTIVKRGAGSVTIQAADMDIIAGSNPGGSIINEQAGELYASVSLRLVEVNFWIITGFFGTWSVT